MLPSLLAWDFGSVGFYMLSKQEFQEIRPQVFGYAGGFASLDFC